MIPLVRGFKLNMGAALDLAPSMHWPEPVPAEHLASVGGPVKMIVRYRIAPGDASGFIDLMHRLRSSRQPGGGYGWSLGQDVSDPGQLVESWYEASWSHYLRHHERIGGADRALQDRIRALHRGATPPTA